jgi:hypothetical protein
MTDPGTTPPRVCACGAHQDYRRPPAEPAEERYGTTVHDKRTGQPVRGCDGDAIRQRDKLAEALRGYGQHLAGCRAGPMFEGAPSRECSCGLTAALSEHSE